MYSFDKETVETFAHIYNRSNRQVNFLYELVGNDIDKYVQLETQLKNNFLMATPGTKEELENAQKNFH